MKALIVVSAAILAVVLWGVVSYQSNAREAEIERQRQVLADCWADAVANQTGGDVCKTLAAQIDQ